jgi:hypothetical protein
MSRDPFVREYVDWLKENGREAALRKEHNPSIIIPFASLVCLFNAYTAIVGVIALVRYVYKRKKARELIRAEWRRLQAMKSILCEPLMVNTEFTRGNAEIAPGLFIGAFEDAWSRDSAVRDTVCDNIRQARAGRLGDDLRRRIQEIYDNEEYVADRRRPLPQELCEGFQVYIFDVALVKEWMNPTAWSDGAWEIICAADRGPAGEIHLIPDEAINRRLAKVAAGRDACASADPMHN